jgi:hypothetical protein
MFPAVAAGDEETVAFVVFNPDPTVAVRVRLGVPGPGRDRDGGAGTAQVPPGGRVALDAPTGAGGVGVVVSAGGPVVAERVLRAADGRREALAPGVPLLEGGEALDALAAAGRLAGAGSAGS